MSYIIAEVEEIATYKTLNIVKFCIESDTLSMMSLELNAKLKKNSKVRVAIKPSHITLCREKSENLSSLNQVEVKITKIESGVLLSNISLDFYGNKLESLITLEAEKRLNLKVNENIIAILNESELSISEILDA